MYKDKYGAWALILGATDGVGKAFADNFARQGMNLALLGRRGSKLQELGEAMKKQYGVEYRVIQQDLSAEDAAANIARATNDLDIGMYCYVAAGITVGSLQKHTVDEHMKIININIINFLKTLHHFEGRMIEKNRGALIAVSSMSGFFGNPYNAAYSASKAFVTNFMNALWYELRNTDIDVLNMILGSTSTPTTLLQKANEDESVIAKKMTPEAAVEDGMPYLGKQMEIIVGEANRNSYHYMSTKMTKEELVEKFATPYEYMG